MRVQLALNVREIDRAVAHYSRMFGVNPHKRREGYANFEIANPPLKLVLFENPGAESDLNHIGVEALSEEEFAEAEQRLQDSGLAGEAADTLCCHARQDKFWIREAGQLAWEWYRVTDDAPEGGEAISGSVCCDGSDQAKEVCCA